MRHPLTTHRVLDTIETIAEIETATGIETEAIEGAQDPHITDRLDASTKETPIPPVETTEPARERTDTVQDEKSASGTETEVHGAAMMIDSPEEIAIYSTTEEEELLAAVVVVVETVIAVDEKSVMSLQPKPADARIALPRRNVNPHQTSPTLCRS